MDRLQLGEVEAEAKVMKSRWHVIVTYKPEDMPDLETGIEELSELHNLIEFGPNWDLIDGILITLNSQD